MLTTGGVLLVGSLLINIVYNKDSGIAILVIGLIVAGMAFGSIFQPNAASANVVIPGGQANYFIYFLSAFASPFISQLMLIIIFTGAGLKIGARDRKAKAGRLRRNADGWLMGFLDIFLSAIIFMFIFSAFHLPLLYGALFGAIAGETSATVVIPYVLKVSEKRVEEGKPERIYNQIAELLTIESAANSVMLLVIVDLLLFFIGTNGSTPTFQSGIGALSHAFDSYLLFHFVNIMELIVTAGGFIIVTVMILNYFPRTLFTQKGENEEAEMSKGMLQYGLLLGFSIILYEVLELEGPYFALDSFSTAVVGLIALFLLNYAVGFFFLKRRNGLLQSSGPDGREYGLSGMTMFHEEFEQMVRIGFFFVVGMQFYGNLLSLYDGGGFLNSGVPSLSVPILGGLPYRGLIEGALFVVLFWAVFMILRKIIGFAGRTMLFTSRADRNDRGVVQIVEASLPRGATAVAVASLLLISGNRYSGIVYDLVMIAVFVSIFEFLYYSAGRRAPHSVTAPAAV